MIEFKSFGKTPYYDSIQMRVTQKIHGSNAQIHIYEEDGERNILVGCRTRWLSESDDNHGFYQFVMKQKESFLKFPIGTHFGEFCGKGINSGEGLTEKRLLLFSRPDRYQDIELPAGIGFVPCLYEGGFVNPVRFMDFLKENGSQLVPGYMKPEGIVIEIDTKRYKMTFDDETVRWRSAEPKPQKEQIDYSYLLQPSRLEKLLSKDERYIREYPKSLPDIMKAYMQDLVDEGQITGDEDNISLIRKSYSREIFHFIKQNVWVTNENVER